MGAELEGNISTGYQRGVVDGGTNTTIAGNLVLRGTIEEYAASPAGVNEFISQMEGKHNELWARITPAQRQTKLHQQEVLEGQTRAVQGDPKAVAPLLEKLATDFLLPY